MVPGIFQAVILCQKKCCPGALLALATLRVASPTGPRPTESGQGAGRSVANTGHPQTIRGE